MNESGTTGLSAMLKNTAAEPEHGGFVVCPPCSSCQRERRRRLGQKTLVQWAKSGDLNASRYAAWGMSAYAVHKLAYQCILG
jgi:hypothetical protein